MDFANPFCFVNTSKGRYIQNIFVILQNGITTKLKCVLCAPPLVILIATPKQKLDHLPSQSLTYLE